MRDGEGWIAVNWRSRIIARYWDAENERGGRRACLQVRNAYCGQKFRRGNRPTLSCLLASR